MKAVARQMYQWLSHPLMAPFPISRSHALAASPPPPVRANVGVRFSERVAVKAFRLRVKNSLRAALVFGRRNQFEMIWAHTISHSAKVVPLHSGRRSAYNEMMDSNLGRRGGKMEEAISTVSSLARPQPAGIRLVDLCPEADRWAESLAGQEASRDRIVMHRKQPLSVSRLGMFAASPRLLSAPILAEGMF